MTIKSFTWLFSGINICECFIPLLHHFSTCTAFALTHFSIFVNISLSLLFNNVLLSPFHITLHSLVHPCPLRFWPFSLEGYSHTFRAVPIYLRFEHLSKFLIFFILEANLTFLLTKFATLHVRLHSLYIISCYSICEIRFGKVQLLVFLEFHFFLNFLQSALLQNFFLLFVFVLHYAV